jgi:hypothetical protein
MGRVKGSCQFSAVSVQTKSLARRYVSGINKDRVDHILSVGEFQLRAPILITFEEQDSFSDNFGDRLLVLRRKTV